MNPQSAAIAGSGNTLKSRFESKIWAKIFSKSADPFAYSTPSTSPTLVAPLALARLHQTAVFVVLWCTRYILLHNLMAIQIYLAIAHPYLPTLNSLMLALITFGLRSTSPRIFYNRQQNCCQMG